MQSTHPWLVAYSREKEYPMSIDQSHGPVRHFTVPFAGTRQARLVVRLDMPQSEFLAAVLSNACQNEPNFKYLMPDEQTRRRVLPWFFRSVAIRASHLYGEIYTTKNIEGGALWISPTRPSNFERMVGTGMLAIPFKLGWGSFRRYINLDAHVKSVRKRLAKGPHWYLMALGVKTSNDGKAIGGALLEPVLSQADSARLPCYLETFDERNLPFYEKHDFCVEGAGHIPLGGPNFWAMMRAPQ